VLRPTGTAATHDRGIRKIRGQLFMATMTDPPSEGFRLSQLIYDTRYRSMTIQVIAFILIMSGLFWLANNTVQNLSALGKDFNFAFLSNRAGYDINQRLIEYSNDSTHGRAAIVGILNTLLVAFLGCIVATILGVRPAFCACLTTGSSHA
jgi:general L-amino acid transport system permease protein